MATLRELKTRIGSVASSEKITGAMKMISSAKVHQNENALKKLAPFRNQIQSIMGHILSTDENFNSPLIESRDVHHASLVVFGSDDGLCGAYNMNIFKGFLVELNRIKQTCGKDTKITVYPVGSKIAKAVMRLVSDELEVIVPQGVDSKMSGEKVTSFTHALRDAFIEKKTDLVEVVYMKFISMGRQILSTDQLFPVLADELLAGESRAEENQLYIFEPDPNSIFNEVLPMYVTSTMHEITVENRASEQAARVMAMQAANDNAKKLFEQLQLEYNKLRQESITTELLDILGGQVGR
ncbi:MAG: ATP synthase F1 subunit gamma [Muribaculaceae bacterium]|nr:ATP synthase F1 subunit gamma [Muribaculaceae bacterium]